MFWQITADLFPGFAQIRSLVDERIAIIHEMEIYADIRGRRIEIRRRNAGDRAPRRESGQILRDVDPVPAFVSVPHLTIVRACPDESFLNLGGCDCKNKLAI